MAPSKARKPCPSAANTGSRVQFKKQQIDSNPSWVIREIIATISIGMLVSVVLWSSILGMAEATHGL